MYCEKCGRTIVFYPDDYKCPCKLFTVLDEENEEHDTYAIDERSAVLAMAEILNTGGDYYLMDHEYTFSANGKKFKVGAEATIEYYAEEIEQCD